MRRTQIQLALAATALIGATSAHAQLPLTVDDASTVEKSAGLWTFPVAVRLPAAPATNVTVDWTLVAGSATAPGDFTMASGTLTFIALVDTTKYIDVEINGDSGIEWSPTLQQDEVFFIQLSNPSANAVLDKPRSTITLWDDERSMPGLQFLSAVNGVAAQNTLQWRVPAAPTQPTDILVRWNQGGGCVSPPDTVAAVTGGQFLLSSIPMPVAGAGQTQSYAHGGRPLVTHCYSLFTIYGGTPTAERMTVKATPFDGTIGPLKWSYSPGCYPPCAAATLAPPSVGFDAVYSVDNYGVLHAMQRGPTGGPWPTTWNPLSLGKPTQSRSAVVPMRVTPTLGDWRLFVGTDAGGVHAVNGQSGRLIWSRSAAFSSALPNDGGAQAAPAGLFKHFGGNNDMILVGTNTPVPARIYALDPATGDDLTPYFSHPDLGRIVGMAAVDYTGNRAFFLTDENNGVLFGIGLGATGSPSLTLATLPGGNPVDCDSGSAGSPVLRNNRLYFPSDGNNVCLVSLADTTFDEIGVGDGGVKGFMWPDRRNSNLYFSTNGKVHAVRDAGATLEEDVWASTLSVSSPSMVLQKPGSDYLYVGDGIGRLVQINASSGTLIGAPLVLDTGFQIGAPSLDGGHDLVVVGSESGRIYGVRVPF